MKVLSLSAEGYRNLSAVSIFPDEGVNVICGDNAQGKTNLIEAIWNFTGAKSFRPSKERDFVKKGERAATISLSFSAQGREQSAKLRYGERREIFLNGVSKTTPAELAGNFCCVVFSPAHLSIVKEGPSVRRRFLDGAICQVRPRYIHVLYQYKKALSQKNAVLKELYKNGAAYDLLDVFDESIAAWGAQIWRTRVRYLNKLGQSACAIYEGLSSSREKLAVGYKSFLSLSPDIPLSQVQGAYREMLRTVRADDTGAGFSTLGVHRDDFSLQIDGLDAKVYGSQGQQRSAALALKLAEGYLLKEVSGETPVMLLDDVMSELDQGRQRYILNHLEGAQVFVTCCDASHFEGLLSGKVFRMERGALSPI